MMYPQNNSITIYPMLCADSRFWLANNREVYTRISGLTSSSWDVKRRNVIDDVTMAIKAAVQSSCRCDATVVTLCSYNDLDQIKGIVGIIKMWKRFRMWQTSFEHGINSLPLVCWRGYGNLPTLSIAISRLAYRRAWYRWRCCVWINSRIRVRKQGVTNSIISHMPTTYRWQYFSK